MEETRVRYIHHDSESSRCTVYTNNGSQHVSIVAEGSNTVLVEVKYQESIRKLRIVEAHVVKLDPSWLDPYEFIEQLDVECAVPINWIFNRLPSWTNLHTVRFTKAAFQEIPLGKEPYHHTFCCPSVTTFELECDPHIFRLLSGPDREWMHFRIQSCVRYAQFSFPELKFCKIVVPLDLEGSLNFFIDFFPHMKQRGEKVTRYKEESVTFTNMQGEIRPGRRQSVPSPVHQQEPRLFRPVARRCSAPPSALGVKAVSPVMWYQTRRTNKDQFLTTVPVADLPAALSPSRSDPAAYASRSTSPGLQRRATVGSSRQRSPVSPVFNRIGSVKLSPRSPPPATQRSYLHP